MRYTTIFFDVDGTIMDSEWAVMDSFRYALKAFGLPEPTAEQCEWALTLSSRKTVELMNVPDPDGVFQAWAMRALEDSQKCRAFPGVIEAIQALRALGVKTGLVTSRNLIEVTEDRALGQWVGLFDVISSADKVHEIKPSPLPLLYGIEQLGVKPSECLYIGDSGCDEGCARAAGVDFALAMWGTREPALTAKYRVNQPNELCDIATGRTMFVRWASEIQNIAQEGLAYSKDRFDLDRFHRLRALSVEMLSEGQETVLPELEQLFAGETGYQTPKLDTRAALFDGDRILLVQELNGLWALPGGWADYDLSLMQNTVKEIREEAGLIAEPVKLVAMLDHDRHHSNHRPYHITTALVLCRATGGSFEENIETNASGYFPLDALPPLDETKTVVEELEMCFEARNDGWVTRFE